MAGQVVNLDTGDAVTITIGDGIRLTLDPDAGATVSYSLVAGPDASGHRGTATDVTERTVIDVEGPYYRVSTAAAPATIFVV